MLVLILFQKDDILAEYETKEKVNIWNNVC